ncbi:MAG: hypothetical protein ABGW74_01075, partial [Campylobacterales bacterium]
YTAKNLDSFQSNNIKWITRVPNQIKENKELIELIDRQRMTPHSKDDRYSYLPSLTPPPKQKPKYRAEIKKSCSNCHYKFFLND